MSSTFAYYDRALATVHKKIEYLKRDNLSMLRELAALRETVTRLEGLIVVEDTDKED